MLAKITYVLAIFYSPVVISNSNEPEEHSTWEYFLLRQTIDPFAQPDYQIWSAQTWFEFLHERESAISEAFLECNSNLDKTFNTIFAAYFFDEIVEAFAPNNMGSDPHKAAWSSKPFQTYVLYSNNVFNCGELYFLARVNQMGLPINTLILNDTKDRPDKVNLKCHNIAHLNIATNVTLEGMEDEKPHFGGFLQIIELEFYGKIPENDLVDEVPNLDISIEKP